jgi:DNA-directed RNA polymerase subunit RPC12/RpoP
MAIEAPTLRCARCGASLAVDPTARAARCTYCGVDTPIDPRTRERARQYAHEFAQQQNRERVALEQAARFDGASRGLFGGGGGVAMPAIADAVASAPCATCGSRVTFRRGETSARCPHCGTTALVTADVRKHLAAHGEARVVLAESTNARAERDARRRELHASGGGSPVKWLLSIFGGGAMFAGWGVFSLLMDDEIDGALVLFGIGGVTMIGSVIAFVALALRPRAILRELRALAAKMNGQVVNRGLGPVFDWLDANWIGENPSIVRILEPGGRCWVMFGGWRGAPVLVAVTHSSDKRIDLLIARRNHTAPPNDGAQDALSHEGWRVRAGPGGAHAYRDDSDPAVLANGGLERLLEMLYVA